MVDSARAGSGEANAKAQASATELNAAANPDPRMTSLQITCPVRSVSRGPGPPARRVHHAYEATYLTAWRPRTQSRSGLLCAVRIQLGHRPVKATKVRQGDNLASHFAAQSAVTAA